MFTGEVEGNECSREWDVIAASVALCLENNCYNSQQMNHHLKKNITEVKYREKIYRYIFLAHSDLGITFSPSHEPSFISVLWLNLGFIWAPSLFLGQWRTSAKLKTKQMWPENEGYIYLQGPQTETNFN